MLKRLKSLKKKLNPGLKENTLRSKITTFIANQHSQQKFTPLVDNFIDKAHVEPLHLKNNACPLAHRLLLNTAISWFKLTVSSFSKVSPHCIFLQIY